MYEILWIKKKGKLKSITYLIHTYKIPYINNKIGDFNVSSCIIIYINVSVKYLTVL